MLLRAATNKKVYFFAEEHLEALARRACDRREHKDEKKEGFPKVTLAPPSDCDNTILFRLVIRILFVFRLIFITFRAETETGIPQVFGYA